MIKLYAHRDKTQPLDLTKFRSVTQILTNLERMTSQTWIPPLDAKTDL